MKKGGIEQAWSFVVAQTNLHLKSFNSLLGVSSTLHLSFLLVSSHPNYYHNHIPSTRSESRAIILRSAGENTQAHFEASKCAGAIPTRQGLDPSVSCVRNYTHTTSHTCCVSGRTRLAREKCSPVVARARPPGPPRHSPDGTARHRVSPNFRSAHHPSRSHLGRIHRSGHSAGVLVPARVASMTCCATVTPFGWSAALSSTCCKVSSSSCPCLPFCPGRNGPRVSRACSSTFSRARSLPGSAPSYRGTTS